MKEIFISFTIKDQSLEQIGKTIRALNMDSDVVLNHGFLPRRTVTRKGFDTGLVDLLDELFPSQVCWNPAGSFDPEYLGKMRQDMAAYAEANGCEVYIVGDVKEGVDKEVSEYEGRGIPLHFCGFEPQMA